MGGEGAVGWSEEGSGFWEGGVEGQVSGQFPAIGGMALAWYCTIVWHGSAPCYDCHGTMDCIALPWHHRTDHAQNAHHANHTKHACDTKHANNSHGTGMALHHCMVLVC